MLFKHIAPFSRQIGLSNEGVSRGRGINRSRGFARARQPQSLDGERPAWPRVVEGNELFAVMGVADSNWRKEVADRDSSARHGGDQGLAASQAAIAAAQAGESFREVVADRGVG